jgi:hypothetical protein
MYDRFIGSRDPQPPAPQIAAYARALLDRYPEDDTPEGEGSPWAGGPLIRPANRPAPPLAPLVLLDTIPAVRPSGPFPDEQTKTAFMQGAVEAVPGFPTPVLDALRGQPGEHAGPPLLLRGGGPHPGAGSPGRCVIFAA